ncbi:MAG: DUF4286 family protein [Flavobacteriales bacterium]|nr:DUF4286 family protein [Flavobacteriia bacterium]NCP07095.1 DUF4286 family protein [Flavobacteriales bacterium]PIV93020.1 MAG: DUF4286 domain-containing protein [Flavobacteriaceae bacterium CG17_big_fil_post_rev_8_21_14_2_50_33_15]PIY09802.1 MAG: DUF4286 domain-containing protein [Flavobacteriaceae bacterium CG_4_10_14_3_um_filter_33_47]PJB18677.1 MAG: DUF4286 domain-containing protein [Flavobacteriaceae bacterium CG_4_9_14_3_um_filter_33_16]
MIIYNVTSNIDETIHVEWLTWIKEHIPQVLATGHFTEAKLTRVLVKEDLGGMTYSIQYRAKSREALDAYYKNNAEILRQEAIKHFGDQVLSFRTELEIIDEYKVNGIDN